MFAANKVMLAIGLAVSAICQTTATASRNLTSTNAAAYMATTYSAMHSTAYPLTDSDTLDTTALEEAIDADMELIAQSFTHVRTFYSQFYGVGVAQYAAAHGIKLHLGVYMTDESWQQDQIDSAVAAVQDYPGSVKAILIGNENLYTGTTASEIIAIATSIKETLGDDADGILFGTVQRSTEYLDTDYDDQINQLSESLDILGVNIYPFFDDSYDSSEPTALLDSVWDAIAAKYSVSQMLLCETGFPTAGDPSTLSPDVTPSLDSSIQYFEAVTSWVPTGAETSLKFWFDFFDRRSDDTSVDVELERHFGIYTYDSQLKSEDYLTALNGASAVASSSSSTTATSTSTTSSSTSTQTQTSAQPITCEQREVEMASIIRALVAAAASVYLLDDCHGAPIDTSLANLAVTYSPMHSPEYPLGNEPFNYDNLSASIAVDMQYISQYFTHART
ncbi:glycoside hydrolase family 17-like protein [Phytophthora cinnamomi]|uniref:glycoside hydrolase family 17-like protein n=1 Tax=Phytophthora cinnamomi TaxID=4785 RepID=UPI0035596D7B|nr:glycoside hydrolase family 17-like protein [Phytophthora cinnamomi]